MPRGKKAKPPAAEIAPISEAAAAVMDRLNEQGANLKPATEALTPLEPPVAETPAQAAAERGEARKNPRRDVEGFINGRATHNTAGIRVSVSFDKNVVAIIFDDDKTPDRGEKDILQQKGFQYNEEKHHRHWERVDRENPAANEIDARRIAADLATGRTEGRSM